MASPTPWTWVWVNSGSWWWTGRPDVLQFMGSQRVGHNWVTELNWTELMFSHTTEIGLLSLVDLSNLEINYISCTWIHNCTISLEVSCIPSSRRQVKHPKRSLLNYEISKSFADRCKIKGESFALVVSHEILWNDWVCVEIKPTSLSLLALSYNSLKIRFTCKVETKWRS